MINMGDRIILRHMTIPGVICSHGTTVYCVQPLENNNYLVTLDRTTKKNFVINEINISRAYNFLTNELVFEHDPRINL